MPNYYKSGSADTDIGPSLAIWGNCPWMEIIADPRKGYSMWTDFTEYVEASGGWFTGGTNPAATLLATEVGGVAQVGGAGADNDEGYITSGNNEAGAGQIGTTTPLELWFEARVRINSITNLGHFIGLSEEGLAGADTLTNDDCNLADKDFVGFHADTAAAATLDAVYRKESSTAEVVKAAVKTLVATTWYKFGIWWRPPYINWYIDGVRQALTSSVTGVEVDHGLKVSAATNFPAGEELAILIGAHDGEGVAKNVDIDWIRFAQRRVTVK